jgi:putative nucleotidyltransferase with HDIG domain
MLEQKRQILFVDDDPLITNGYKRSLDEFSDEWDTYFTNSGKEALVFLAKQPIDVIVTDLHMPEMDGNELLEKVTDIYPQTIRFVLSGNIDELRSIKTAHSAHQQLIKPCDLSLLHKMVENSCRLKDTLTNPLLKARITGLKRIPSLPSLYLKLTEELQTKDPEPRIIGDIISHDVAMTAKILQLVNSAFFGLPTEITSAQRAATILGTNIIKALVLGSQVFAEYQSYSNPWFSIEKLWQHSLIVGNLSKSIAASAGLSTNSQEQAQLAGMLHDIGKLLELDIPGYSPTNAIQNAKDILDAEYRVLGTSHAELGAYLLGLWGLPQAVVESVAYHHNPSAAGTGEIGVITAVHIANGLYHQANETKQETHFEDYLDIEYVRRLNLDTSLVTWATLTDEFLHKTGIKE